MTLQEVTSLTTSELAKATGKKVTNLSQYLCGSKPVGKSAVASAVKHLADWGVAAHAEVELLPTSLAAVPEVGGIYALYDSSRSAIYVGQATNLRAELRQTLQRKTNFPVRTGPLLSKKKHPKYKDVTVYYSAYAVPSARLKHNLEALLLRVFPNQSHNNKLGKFR
jgi:hypothetical protein